MIERLQSWHSLISHGFRMSCNYLGCVVYEVPDMVILTMTYCLLCGDMAHRDVILLPITGNLLNYSRTSKPEVLDMMVIYLGVDSKKAQQEIDDTKWCLVRFSFLVDLYERHLAAFLDANVDDTRVGHHRAWALRSYLVVLVCMSIFVYKSVTYVDVIHLRYFIDFERNHKYNSGISYLVYLYYKLVYSSLWKTVDMK